MSFSPGVVLDWYRSKPTWVKWLPLIIGLVLAGVWWFLGRVTSPRGGATATDAVLDVLEEQLADDEKAAEAKDRELADKIQGEKDGREARAQEREERQEDNEGRHDKINNTPNDAHDVVGLLDPDRRRRGR